MTETTKVNLLGLTRSEMGAFFTEMGEKAFRASQVMKWIYHHGVTDFDAMTDLGKALRAKLQERAEIRLPEVVVDAPSRDGTRKWMLRLGCDQSIECVFIPEDDRGTLCISSQVGCTLNCSFCSTAQQGFSRNLTVAEIIGQILFAAITLGIPENKGERVITNIVLMGMGEPLMNFDNVIKAVEIMQDDVAFGVSKRRVTLSTSGVVPAMYELRKHTDISLAVSLHAPNDELRNQLVPINRKYPIAELLEACRAYVADLAHRSVTIEYVMIDGVNDSADHARQLSKLLRSVPCKVNLIPFNPFPGSPYKRSPREVVARFQDILMAAGITCITRRTRGDDIAAACGQLVGEVQDRTRRSERLSAIPVRSTAP